MLSVTLTEEKARPRGIDAASGGAVVRICSTGLGLSEDRGTVHGGHVYR